MHTGPEPDLNAGDAPAVAIYIQFYSLLDEYIPTSAADRVFFNAVKRASIGNRELVLSEREVLLKGKALLCIKRSIKVVVAEDLMESCSSSSSSDPRTYLCRLAMDVNVWPFSATTQPYVFLSSDAGTARHH
jgi:hypothetical protein